MATLFVRHKVEEFDAWKTAYDAFNAERKTMGVTSHGVYQTDGNLNDVTVYHRFDSMDKAKAFASSARLKDVMEEAGVIGAPDVWFASEA